MVTAFIQGLFFNKRETLIRTLYLNIASHSKSYASS